MAHGTYERQQARIDAIVKETKRLGGKIFDCDDAHGAGASSYIKTRWTLADGDYVQVDVRVSDHAPSIRDTEGWRHLPCDLYVDVKDGIQAMLAEFRFAVCAAIGRENYDLARTEVAQ